MLAQLFSDVAVLAWITVWVLVGMAVHSAIATIATVGRQVHDGANGVADNLDSAGDSAHHIPLVGDTLSKPLRAASEAALDIAGAGSSLDSTASWLAWVLALAVAAAPILFVAMPWLYLRVRFFRRKWTAITLASTAAGEQLLALRALANRPLSKLTAVSDDPVGAWRREEPRAIRGLAALELRSAGMRLRRLD
ncbi:transmembrane protein [Mycolicibacterium brisbanense]|uniref:Transmembrane protein n=1 Tax=Mycolicibacterium brisbanense TaxID=146020 RepID=A0A100W621_9MYCO|nr:transmembrane protein [Mycolicibacterium brisbanense]